MLNVIDECPYLVASIFVVNIKKEHFVIVTQFGLEGWQYLLRDTETISIFTFDNFSDL